MVDEGGIRCQEARLAAGSIFEAVSATSNVYASWEMGEMPGKRHPAFSCSTCGHRRWEHSHDMAETASDKSPDDFGHCRVHHCDCKQFTP